MFLVWVPFCRQVEKIPFYIYISPWVSVGQLGRSTNPVHMTSSGNWLHDVFKESAMFSVWTVADQLSRDGWRLSSIPSTAELRNRTSQRWVVANCEVPVYWRETCSPGCLTDPRIINFRVVLLNEILAKRGKGIQWRGSSTRPLATLSCYIESNLPCTPFRLVLGPTQPLVQWMPWAPSAGIKQPETEAYHSSLITAEIKNKRIYTSPLHTSSWGRRTRLQHSLKYYHSWSAKLAQTFVDREVSHVSVRRFPTAVNLSYLDRNRYFSFK
jgi:hypothetical protein